MLGSALLFESNNIFCSFNRDNIINYQYYGETFRLEIEQTYGGDSAIFRNQPFISRSKKGQPLTNHGCTLRDDAEDGYIA